RGSPRARSARPWSNGSASWSRRRPSPSTTSAGPRRTAGTHRPFSPAARSPGRGRSTCWSEPMRVTFTVNAEKRQADDVWEGESLLYVLRERLRLARAKNAWEEGEGGACPVSLDGLIACACLVPAGQVEGRDVVTVEGLAEEEHL